MEPKKIKKLEIKKEVIVTFDDPAMSALKGGIVPTDITACATCAPYSCNIPCPTIGCYGYG